MKILDMSAGNRAVWYNKSHADAVYVDIRPQVRPGVVADSRNLPFADRTFDLVVFDPPHENFGASGNMSKNYGHHTAAQIRDIVARSAREAFRVSKHEALMAFKWNDCARKLADILVLMPHWAPLFGHGVCHQQMRKSMTAWVMLRRSAR
jgi:hypothetical protein